MVKAKKKPNPRPPRPDFWVGTKPIAIAHRGGDGAGKNKKNTLEAFESAWKQGIKYAEADVIRAASGELVVVHGSHNWIHAGISRGVTSRVLEMMTLDQINYLTKPSGDRVMLLEELLSLFPKMKFVLDVKTDQAVEPLAKTLKRLKATERVCLSGYSYNRTLNFVEACRPAATNAGLTVGRGIRFRNMNMFMLKSGRLKGVEAIFMHHSLVSRPMVSLIHHRGFKAVVWTANSGLGIKHAIRCGADGVISDRVDLLKKIVSKSTK
ncbi:MAG: glycerophosphodiester phosphodiesterase [Candidatus Saccharimonadales bacterium]